MDPLTAAALGFSLGTPLAAALVYAAWKRDQSEPMRRAALRDVGAAVKGGLRALAASNQEIAKATVKAAKYRAGILPNAPDDAPAVETPTLFARWASEGGYLKSEAIRDGVEGCIAFLLGEDSGAELGAYGSQGGAKRYLDEHAPGVYQRVMDEIDRRRMPARR